MFSNVYFIIYLIVAYLGYSLYGLIQVGKYIRACVEAEIVPFQGSIGRAVTICLVSGLFTTLALFLGAFQILFENKDENE